jgi:regulator of RNase E activity RraA
VWYQVGVPTPDVLASLQAFDTPTICNALEVVAPERTGYGYTTRPLVCVRPDLPPIVGYARTATIRAVQPSGRKGDAERDARLAYYEAIAAPPHPTIAVIEDLDPAPGVGAWWGEVQTHLHRGLGASGVVTNGSVRDLDQLAEGFQVLAGNVGPSHAFVHPVELGVPVNVHGMAVRPGDIVHADRHGAVVVPEELAERLAEAAAELARQEAVLIEGSKKPGFDFQVLRSLMTGGRDH